MPSSSLSFYTRNHLILEHIITSLCLSLSLSVCLSLPLSLSPSLSLPLSLSFHTQPFSGSTHWCLFILSLSFYAHNHLLILHFDAVKKNFLFLCLHIQNHSVIVHNYWCLLFFFFTKSFMLFVMPFFILFLFTHTKPFSDCTHWCVLFLSLDIVI